MSRCFPFPSSDLSREDASRFGSIKKLYNESGNVKHGKEKSKENKKRSRQHLEKLDDSAHNKKIRRDRESELFKSFRDRKKDASDQCERSGVTEERGPPCSIPDPCNSLESTQNSSKKNKLLVADMKKKEQGLVLRIKLPLMKHKEPVTAKEEDPCFSGRVTEALIAKGVAAIDLISSSCGKQEMGKCFSDLILNWNPSSLPSDDLNPGSEDWLFAPPLRPPPNGNCGKASNPDHKVGLISPNSLQPQACYLPEFDIYQLPYVIPF